MHERKRTSHALLLGLLLTLGLALHGCGGGSDGSTPPAGPLTPTAEQLKSTCNTLNGQVIEGVTITKTTRFEAKAPTHAAGFCQVLGTRAPFLDIEVDVPDNWTGRYWQQGGAGLDGRIFSAVTIDASGAVTDVSPALAEKAAVYAASNGGNRAHIPAQAAPAVWVDGTAEGRQSAADFAYAAVGTTMRFGKAVTKVFFSKAPSHSYFNGCSNGGRNAYIAAQRWPQEFDGIVAGCAGMDVAGQTSVWLRAASLTGTPAALSSVQTSAAHAAALSACDALDGATDNLIGNPQACAFDPAVLQCGMAGANPDPTICLSAAQVGTMKSFLSDLKLSNGSAVYSGFWWGNGVGQGWGGLGGSLALLASGDPAWLTPIKQAGFQLEPDHYMVGADLARIGADHDKVAVASFVASGRKLISWHAGSDALSSPNDHHHNWTTMTGIARSMGIADPNSATRFFIVPGGAHGAGSTLQEVDWAPAIMGWVEDGQAPTQMNYTFTRAGTARSMPACQYPKYPKYNGTGDINVASSYACT